MGVNSRKPKVALCMLEVWVKCFHNCLSIEHLMNLAVKSNGDRGVDGIYYMLPGCRLKKGLRKIDGDNDVVDLQAIQNRAINVYVLRKYPNLTKPVLERMGKTKKG